MASIIEFDIKRTTRICPGCKSDYLYILNGKINTCPCCGYYELLRYKDCPDWNNVKIAKEPPPYPFLQQYKNSKS